jgi:hypothetical protein
MNPINRFTLENHDSPYETWPLRSRLFLDSKPAGVVLLGYVLLHQFETPYAYVLVTDYGFSYQEVTNFAWIGRHLRLLSCRWLG